VAPKESKKAIKKNERPKKTNVPVIRIKSSIQPPLNLEKESLFR
jgi:hypothetical protein